MRKRSKMIKYLRCSMAVIAVLFLSACGGGGGGGDAPTGEVKPSATMDQETAEKTAAMVLSYENLKSISNTGIETATPSTVSPSGNSVSRAANLLNDEDVVRAGSHSTSEECETSGTMDVSSIWDGPDFSDTKVDDICEIQNMSWTTVFSECVEDDTTTNGSVAMTFTGSSCEPTGVSSSWQNLSRDDGEKHFACTSFNSEMTAMKWDAEKNLTNFKITINGDMSFNDFSLAYNQYTMEVSDGGTHMTYAINGFLKGACMDGWVAVKTLSPIRKNNDAACPYDGHVQITGADDVTVDVVYNSDGSIDIGDRHYDACGAPAIADKCQPPS